MTVVPSDPPSLTLLAEVQQAGGMFINENGQPVGIELPTGLSWDQYEAIGVMLWNAHELTRWCIGDWIAYGEDAWRHDLYEQAVAMTGLSINTLQNYASTSRLVPPQRRRLNVSHSIHVTVKSLNGNQQRQILAKAEREGLTKEAVRGLMKEMKGIEPEPIERPVCPECKRPL